MNKNENIESRWESTVHYQRFMLGIICGLLPILCTLFGLLVYGVDNVYRWSSISITYQSSFAFVMISALTLCTFFLGTYKGYDLGDRVLTLLAAIGAAGVVLFPCTFDKLAPVTPWSSFFAFIPPNISDILHYISAGLVFGSFALMILTQFTKGKQLRKNILYRICGWIMVAAIICLLVCAFIPSAPGWLTMVWETIMLEAFSVAFLVKSGVTLDCFRRGH